MYNLIKRRAGGRTAAFAAAVLCAVYLVCYMTVGFAAPTKKIHKPGTVEITAVDGVIKSCDKVNESGTSVSCQGDTATISVDGLACPGANAVVTVTAKNTGTLDATLVDVSLEQPDSDFIKAEIADIPVGEVLKPGDTCTFDVAVYWDPSRDDIESAQESASFNAVLSYENDEYIYVSEGGEDVPKTGDNSHTTLFAIIAGVCGVVLIGCIVFIILGKKKNKEDDGDEE